MLGFMERSLIKPFAGFIIFVTAKDTIRNKICLILGKGND
jgi:hypothetical protein